jgi:hypothetical protein
LPREQKLDRQSQPDPYYSAWGEHPPALKADESVDRYRRRAVKDLQAHLPATAPLEGERIIEEADPHTGARTTYFNRRSSFIADMGLPRRKVINGSQGLRQVAELNSKLR